MWLTKRLMSSSSSAVQDAKYAFDLVVIGGGSGGVRAARISAGHGARVALVETSMHHGPPSYSAIGGTCVNVGCVPKKLLVYASKFPAEFKLGESFGHHLDQQSAALVDWTKLVENKNTEITRLNGAYGRILSSAPKLGGSMRVIEGHASLVDANTVKVSSPDGKTVLEQLSTKRVLICVGGWPVVPKDLKQGRELVVTSNELFYLKSLPKRAVVVGGGYIAVEFAGILRGLGVDVTQLYRGEMFLRGFDNSCREHLLDEMKKKGVDVRLKTNPAKVEKNASGKLTVTNEDGSVLDNVDLVMYATGRQPKLDGLGLEALGVKIGSKGEIVVNERNETNVPGVYAVGDCTDRLNLTPVALREGHLLADSLFGNRHRTVDYDLVPCAVFSNPEFSMVGLSEESAVEKFRNVSVFVSTFKPMKYTLAAGATERSLFKLVVDDNTNRVVGLHAITDNAAEIVQGFAVALRCGATKQQFDDTIGIHPTSAEEFVTMRTPSYKFVNGVKASL